VIEAAKRLGRGITFQGGDAEALEFDEGAFDGVTSTFGVMFVAGPAAAAGEIARVLRKGGRLALVTWLPGGPVEDLFELTRTFMPAPPTESLPSSFEWSGEERVHELLGGAFELAFERGTNVLRMPSGQIMWDIFVTGFGPMKALAASLDSAGRTALERQFVSLHEMYRTPAGLAVPRDYIVTIGVRR
jgi:SAM-dependent methyltransferase